MKTSTARRDDSNVAPDRKRRGHGDKLGRKADAAIVALLAHDTY